MNDKPDLEIKIDGRVIVTADYDAREIHTAADATVDELRSAIAWLVRRPAPPVFFLAGTSAGTSDSDFS